MSDMDLKLIRIKAEMVAELHRAMDEHGSFPSGFHGHGVILEELEELWEAVKDENATLEDMRKEAIQIGSSAMRFILDLCDQEEAA